MTQKMKDMIRGIEVENFKTFERINIKELSKVNLFFGENNSGKSTILQVISLMEYRDSSIVKNSLNFLKGKDLKYLYHNFNMQKPVSITFLSGIGPRKVTIFPVAKDSQIRRANFSNSIPKDLFSIQEVLTIDSINVYKQIAIKRKDNLLLSFLKKLDERIEQIVYLDDIYLGIRGVDELLPLELMGDGINYVFKILASIINGHNIILIDEIENGLHYSAHRELWRAIMKLYEDFDFQLFITSHSLETLRALKEVLEEEAYSKMQEYVKTIKIAHTKKAGAKSYTYDFDAFQTMIDSEIEIR